MTRHKMPKKIAHPLLSDRLLALATKKMIAVINKTTIAKMMPSHTAILGRNWVNSIQKMDSPKAIPNPINT